MNPVCADNIAISEVDTSMSFQVEMCCIFQWTFCPELNIEKVRVE